MPELRHNFLTDEWVYISTERLNRPQYFKENKVFSHAENTECPFCPQNAFLTPEKVFESADKRVKIVPNKYPAVSEISLSGYGIHDVLVDTPFHEERFVFFSAENIFTALESIQKRMEDILKDKKIKYIQIFKNEGKNAGASIYHSHWQIVSLPIITNKQKTIRNNFKNYYDENKTCFVCDLIKNITEYIVEENEDFIAFMPYSSIYCFGVEIVPKKHISDFREFSATQLFSLSKILKNVLLRLNAIIKPMNYNICFQNTIYDEDFKLNHFYIQIIPRVSNMAGFEFSTGCFINSVEPIDAATQMRSVIIEN